MKKILKAKQFADAEHKPNDVTKDMLMFDNNRNVAVTLNNNNAYHFITVSAEGTKITIELSYECTDEAEKLYDTITDWVVTDEPTLCVETEVVKEEFSCGCSWRMRLKSINK